MTGLVLPQTASSRLVSPVPLPAGLRGLRVEIVRQRGCIRVCLQAGPAGASGEAGPSAAAAPVFCMAREAAGVVGQEAGDG